MTTFKALRADVITFSGDPFLEPAEKCLVHIPDAIVAIDGGRIVDVGPASEVARGCLRASRSSTIRIPLSRPGSSIRTSTIRRRK
ncbi:C-terminal processing protease CtpA/Prc [Caballeronia udeis]|jgi:hypothetical protein|uniref:C-terminal processing protease CtpA/Prc n=1 Tax=Caballeronia udeis TaxID=1232866 RepID=A0ABW8MMZ8_9BURK